jgi:hypothetical protein
MKKLIYAAAFVSNQFVHDGVKSRIKLKLKFTEV